MPNLALYTTVYPAVLRFLPDWYRSVQAQTDTGFRLWVGLDAVDTATVERVLDRHAHVDWVQADSGDTPAQVRQRALTRIVRECEMVVLVDSDDLLHPSRVAAARHSLRDSDVNGCALRLVDESGDDLDLTLDLPRDIGPDDVLPRHNIFGLSNSAYRSSILGQCLPIPADVTVVDWFLASRAWLCGARFSFDSAVRMDYRQYAANTARTRLPFTADRIRSDTCLVRRHFQILQANLPAGALTDRLVAVAKVAADVEDFYQQVVISDRRLQEYGRALNAMAPAPLWWASVAHPSLKHLWTTKKEPR